MAPSLFVLTGAGISAESGLNTFRASEGLWENHPVQEVASIDGYRRNPTLVQNFYNMRRRDLLRESVQPNKAHKALVQLEQQWPGDFLLVTQNVDDLHERAGSRKLIHMHGELLKVRCEKTSQVFECKTDITNETPCPGCQGPSCVRPHIVWFGEMPFQMDQIHQFLETCGLFISIGTSGVVYPAAGFVAYARANSKVRTVEVNLEPTHVTSLFDEQRQGTATEQVPRLVRELLS